MALEIVHQRSTRISCLQQSTELGALPNRSVLWVRESAAREVTQEFAVGTKAYRQDGPAEASGRIFTNVDEDLEIRIGRVWVRGRRRTRP
jgi:hypothetical protein